jgi:hypothetical protein
MFLKRRITTAMMMLKICNIFALTGAINLSQPEFDLVTIYVQVQHASLKAEFNL